MNTPPKPPPNPAFVQPPVVCIVDDDEAVRDSLGWLLDGNGFSVRAFDSAESFLAAERPTADDATQTLPDAFLSGRIVDAQSKLNVMNLVEAGKPVPEAVAAFTKLFGLLGLPAQDLEIMIASLQRVFPAPSTAAATANNASATPAAPTAAAAAAMPSGAASSPAAGSMTCNQLSLSARSYWVLNTFMRMKSCTAT